MQKHRLDLSTIKAAIFDIDGTMVDNNHFHKEAFFVFSKKHGIKMTDDYFAKELSGKTNAQIMPKIFDKELTEEEIAKYANEKEAIYRELYSPHFSPLTGLNELITKFIENNIKLAIASNAPPENRKFTLEKLGFKDIFSLVVGAEQVERGKPYPDMYLHVAEQIRISPQHSIVFEDSPTGIEAAKRAGMKAIALKTFHTEDELKDADLIIRNFSELEI
jgi:beta-phosphoglucomutase